MLHYLEFDQKEDSKDKHVNSKSALEKRLLSKRLHFIKKSHKNKQ